MTDLGPESGGESEAPNMPLPQPIGQAAYTALRNLRREWCARGPRYVYLITQDYFCSDP
jgi:hypothetical protein